MNIDLRHIAGKQGERMGRKIKTGEKRVLGTTMLNSGCLSGGKATGTTPEGRNQMLYKNEQ